MRASPLIDADQGLRAAVPVRPLPYLFSSLLACVYDSALAEDCIASPALFSDHPSKRRETRVSRCSLRRVLLIALVFVGFNVAWSRDFRFGINLRLFLLTVLN